RRYSIGMPTKRRARAGGFWAKSREPAALCCQSTSRILRPGWLSRTATGFAINSFVETTPLKRGRGPEPSHRVRRFGFARLVDSQGGGDASRSTFEDRQN